LSVEVHLWRAELDAPGWPGPEDLPPAEGKRAEQMREPGAARWVAARWALRQVLASHLEEDPATIELTAGPHGKPQLATDPDRLRFNLSHSGELALIAVCDELEVGVDVERVRPDREVVALAERALPPEDVAAVREAAGHEQAAVFHQRWACHEARLKCLGIGLSGTRQAADPVATEAIEVGPGYAAAVAVAAAEMPSLRGMDARPTAT
jgi:4'-phosphopantetheinyl transferase